MVWWFGVAWGGLGRTLSIPPVLSLSVSLSLSGERSVRRTCVPNGDMLGLRYKPFNLGAEKSPGLAYLGTPIRQKPLWLDHLQVSPPSEIALTLNP